MRLGITPPLFSRDCPLRKAIQHPNLRPRRPPPQAQILGHGADVAYLHNATLYPKQEASYSGFM